MIRHIVGWNFKEGFTEEEKQQYGAKMKEDLEGLKELIWGTISIRVELKPAKTSTREVILISDFETETDLMAYQVHPEHKRTTDFVRSVMTDRVCLDFSWKEDNQL